EVMCYSAHTDMCGQSVEAFIDTAFGNDGRSQNRTVMCDIDFDFNLRRAFHVASLEILLMVDDEMFVIPDGFLRNSDGADLIFKKSHDVRAEQSFELHIIFTVNMVRNDLCDAVGGPGEVNIARAVCGLHR